jgi:hypothetical protein
MSTTGTLTQRGGIQTRRVVAAIVASVAIGAGIGSVVTNAVADDSTPASQANLSPGAWDPQKLDAMGKRQQAELVIREATGQG